MKTTRRRLLQAVPPALLALSLPELASAMETDPSSVLKTLRAGHPRLIATNEDIARAKSLAASDPTARQYLESVRRHGEQILAQPPVEYKLIGPRLLDKSRTALDRVYTLATLYRLDGDAKWLERAKKELLTVAAFPDWHPPHFLDTAEMTHAAAIGYDWLYDALTPDERKTLRTAIVEFGLKPGLAAYGGKAPFSWWAKSEFNWNQVCNGGLILGALAIADAEPEIASQIVSSALRSLPRAMASFAPDGGWIEGPGYWGYTVQYTTALLAGLTSALGTDFGISQATGFDGAGTFRLCFVGPTGKTFNYADAGEGAGDEPPMYWLARRFHQPLYAGEARRSAGRGGSALDLLWYEPSTGDVKSAGAPRDNVFRAVNVAFLRSAWEDPSALWVGFKGGDNAANHAHLDLGAFVFDALGERWVSNLGGDNYNLPGYFGKERWTYYRLNTHGQNTLLLNDANQAVKAKAPLVAFSGSAEHPYVVADLTAGYASQGATRVQRGIALVNGRRGLLVQDEFAATSPAEYRWQVHTRATVTTDGATATLTQNGKTLKAYALSPAGAAFAVESAAPPQINGGQGPQQNPNAGFQRLVVRLPEKTSAARVAVLLAPADAPASASVTPLEEWIRIAPPLPARGGSLTG